jgi:hypothetical protein
VSDLMLEVGTDGRPGRLEVATAAGLLTLHPEADGASAHGNVVGPDGVRPLAFDWSPGHWFESRQGPLVSAAMCRALRSQLRTGEFRVVPGLHVDDELRVSRGVRGVTRLTDSRFLITEADQSGWELSFDDDGLPIFGAGERRLPGSTAAPVWPLELTPGATFDASLTIDIGVLPAGIGLPVVVGLAMQVYAFVDGPDVVRRLLMTSAFDAWHGLLTEPAYFKPLLYGTLVSGMYLVVCLGAAYSLIRRRDIGR